MSKASVLAQECHARCCASFNVLRWALGARGRLALSETVSFFRVSTVTVLFSYCTLKRDDFASIRYLNAHLFNGFQSHMMSHQRYRYPR